jgi:ribonucleoside-diphosphate reductase alpha chain
LSHAPFNTAFAHSVVKEKYLDPNGEKQWRQLAGRVSHHPMQALYEQTRLGSVRRWQIQDSVLDLINRREFMPGGRYMANVGNPFHQVQNCLLLSVEDTREGWADLSYKTFMALMTGAGIGVYYGKLREHGAVIKRTGGVASGPVPLMLAINEQSRAAVQGGNRRAAIWAGLLWSHPDIFSFIGAKKWPDWLREQKQLDFNTPAPLDMTNISVCLDDDFFHAYADHATELLAPAPDGGTWHDWAKRVYWATVESMVTTGEPGFSVDLGEKRDEKLRNACTEIVSSDDSDICNLGGIVLSRFDDPKAFGKAVHTGVEFLTAGTVYSDVPYEKVAEVREKNRRLGLDILGVHDFLLQRGLRYGTDDSFEALDPFMAEYDRALEYANDFQDSIGLSLSVAASSGAPTGTRGIGAETTTGWEPMTHSAYKRAVTTSGARLGDTKRYTYVVDPTLKRLVEQGIVAPDAEVEDSASLAYDYERRFKMQEYAQRHTDQAISMTINLPYVMKDAADQRAFGETLLRYLPSFRGVTVYPDGAIPGQPIIKVPLAEALAQEGLVVEESEDKCASGVCGI